MALRNQPYFPLYVQDYLTDEKLNSCSWATQGVYIKILCVLHKQESYGKILFKQMDKQNLSRSFNFALQLLQQIPCREFDMINAINELLENNVLSIDGDYLLQKRMVKDGQISMARTESGKKGGGNPNLFKQKDKQKDKQNNKQNTEYENEIENECINENKIVIEKGIDDRKIDFFNLVGMQYSNEYSESLLKEFCEYWSEHNPNGKRMRFEMEKVFDISRRLKTWSKNNFSNNGKPKSKLDGYAESVARSVELAKQFISK